MIYRTNITKRRKTYDLKTLESEQENTEDFGERGGGEQSTARRKGLAL